MLIFDKDLIDKCVSLIDKELGVRVDRDDIIFKVMYIICRCFDEANEDLISSATGKLAEELERSEAQLVSKSMSLSREVEDSCSKIVEREMKPQIEELIQAMVASSDLFDTRVSSTSTRFEDVGEKLIAGIDSFLGKLDSEVIAKLGKMRPFDYFTVIMLFINSFGILVLVFTV